MLAVGGPAHGFVVSGGAVAAGDDYGAAEVVADLLQQGGKAAVHEHRVRAIFAGKLGHGEVCAQLPGAVPRAGPGFKHRLPPPPAGLPRCCADGRAPRPAS